jgi:hypothetical protein
METHLNLLKMKSGTIHFSLLLTLIACSNNSTTEPTNSTTATGSENAASPVTSSNEHQGSGIVGKWELALEAYDDNSNRKLDDEERKKGIQNRYSFRFNADGTCQIRDVYKGRYEMKTENNRKVLKVYRNRIPGEEDQDPPPDVFEITSMSNNELVLLETLGDHTFWIFKRTG